jgi:hypothetical protein
VTALTTQSPNYSPIDTELTWYLSPCETTLARLQEVSTIPGTACDIFCTPLGSAIRSSSRPRVLAAVKQSLAVASCSHKATCRSLKLLKIAWAHSHACSNWSGHPKHQHLKACRNRLASNPAMRLSKWQARKQMAGQGGEAIGVQPTKGNTWSEKLYRSLAKHCAT